MAQAAAKKTIRWIGPSERFSPVAATMAHGQDKSICLPGAAPAAEVAGQVRSCGAWNTLVEVGGRTWALARTASSRWRARQPRWPRCRRSRATTSSASPPAGRARPRARRRHRRGRRGADRRRPRHRQRSTLLLQALDALARVRTAAGPLYVTVGARRAAGGRRSGGTALTGERRRARAGAVWVRRCGAGRDPAEASSPRWRHGSAGGVRDRLDQTVYSEQLSSAPGSVAQVRECAAHLTRTAKAAARRCAGRPRDEGRRAAGPRVLEHIVDTVLYFEGDTHSSLA